jgi:pimeloyl-ACP methyl ester carboxylesterase
MKPLLQKIIGTEKEQLEATPFYRGGSGEPMLLLHAGWTSWRIWTPILEHLTLTYDVLALTLPGHMGGPELSQGEELTLETATSKLVESLEEFGFETIQWWVIQWAVFWLLSWHVAGMRALLWQ